MEHQLIKVKSAFKSTSINIYDLKKDEKKHEVRKLVQKKLLNYLYFVKGKTGSFSSECKAENSHPFE